MNNQGNSPFNNPDNREKLPPVKPTGLPPIKPSNPIQHVGGQSVQHTAQPQTSPQISPYSVKVTPAVAEKKHASGKKSKTTLFFTLMACLLVIIIAVAVGIISMLLGASNDEEDMWITYDTDITENVINTIRVYQPGKFKEIQKNEVEKYLLDGWFETSVYWGWRPHQKDEESDAGYSGGEKAVVTGELKNAQYPNDGKEYFFEERIYVVLSENKFGTVTVEDYLDNPESFILATYGQLEQENAVTVCSFCSEEHSNNEHICSDCAGTAHEGLCCKYCQTTAHITADHPLCTYCSSPYHNISNCQQKKNDDKVKATSKPLKQDNKKDDEKKEQPVSETCKYCAKTEHTSANHMCEKCGEKGHDILSCQATVCVLCNKTGHEASTHQCSICSKIGHENNCPCEICQRTTHKTQDHLCTNCQQKGHDASECTITVCAICEETGHISEKHVCTNCLHEGHQSDTCCIYCGTKQLHDTAGHVCTACNSKGHDKTDCPNQCEYCKTYEHSSREHVCENCSSTGHNKDSCTVKVCSLCGKTEHEASNHNCERCGSSGHDEKSCTVTKCYYCGSFEHTTVTCPICELCMRQGHVKENCPNVACPICENPGHKKQDCPDGKKCDFCGVNKDHVTTEHVCSWCGVSGHEKEQDPASCKNPKRNNL